MVINEFINDYWIYTQKDQIIDRLMKVYSQISIINPKALLIVLFIIDIVW